MINRTSPVATVYILTQTTPSITSQRISSSTRADERGAILATELVTDVI